MHYETAIGFRNGLEQVLAEKEAFRRAHRAAGRPRFFRWDPKTGRGQTFRTREEMRGATGQGPDRFGAICEKYGVRRKRRA